MQVSSSYPQATASFAPELMDLLDKHHVVLEPPLRQVGALPPLLLCGNQLAGACVLPNRTLQRWSRHCARLQAVA